MMNAFAPSLFWDTVKRAILAYQHEEVINLDCIFARVPFLFDN